MRETITLCKNCRHLETSIYDHSCKCPAVCKTEFHPIYGYYRVGVKPETINNGNCPHFSKRGFFSKLNEFLHNDIGE